MILQRSWSWKVRVIGQKGTIRFLDLKKHISWCQNRHSRFLSSKVMVKAIFLHNGDQRNTFAYVSGSNHSRCILMCWKALIQAILCYNLVPIVPAVTKIWPTMLIYRVVTLKVKVTCEGQQYFAKLPALYPWGYKWSFIEIPLAVSLENLGIILPKSARGQEKKKKHRRNSLTDVGILWCKLCHEGAIWHKSDHHINWRSFPEFSFGITWVSVHRSVIEIDPAKLCLKST